MRELAYIHGISPEESAQRAGNAGTPSYIPYLNLTQGEMTLALLAEKSRIMADYYASPVYKQEAQMFQNALYRGIHGSTPYMGALSPQLMRAARAINYASRLSKPASTLGMSGRVNGFAEGVYIGADAPIIPYTVQEGKCKEWVAQQLNTNKLAYIKDGKPKDYAFWDSVTKGWDQKKWGPTASDMFYQCVNQGEIEKILNDHIEKCGHHTLYGYLPGGNSMPQTITSKRLSERMGQEVLANVGNFDAGLMRNWLNVGVMRYNVTAANLQPYNQLETNAILTNLPPEGQTEWINTIANWQKIRGGTASDSQLAYELMAILRKYQQPGVGFAPAVAAALAIIAACTAALKVINDMITNLKAKKADAFATVSGIGTQAFGPEGGDWTLAPGGGGSTTASGSDSKVPLLIGAGLVAAVVISNN